MSFAERLESFERSRTLREKDHFELQKMPQIAHNMVL